MKPRLAPACFAVLLALVPLGSWAQDGSGDTGGDAVATADGVQWIRLNGWGGELGVRGEALFSESSVESARGRAETTSRESTYLLEERVRLNLDGSVFHPRFLAWDVGGGVSFVQGWRSRTGLRDKSGDGVRYEYQGQIKLLPTHAYGLTLDARRNDQEVLDLYVDSVRVIQESFGATARWRGPVDLRAFARVSDYEQRGFARREETRTTAGASARYDGVGGRLDLDYAYVKVHDHIFAQSFYTNRESLVHILATDVDSELRGSAHSLSSQGLAQDQHGVSDFALYRWNEAYTYRPLRELRFDLSGAWQETHAKNSFTTRVLSASGSATHQLYESLTTGVGLNWERSLSRRSSQRRGGGSWSAGYRKRIPHGQINLGYNGSLTRTEREDDGAARLFLDEPVVLADATVTLLAGERLVPGSVFVTDTAGAIAYVEGIDYQLQTVGRSTRILRLPAGGILDGQSVLVDYTHLGGGDSEYDTWTHGFNASVRLFDLLSPFYEWQIVRPKRLDDSTGSLPDRRTAQNWGVTFSWRWIEATYEGSDVHSRRGSHRGHGVSARLTLKPTTRTTLTLSGRHRETTFDRRRERITLVRLQSSWTATSELSLHLGGSWEHRQADNRDNTYLLLVSEVKWRYGKLEVGLNGRYLRRIDQDVTQNDDVRVALEISRRF